MLFISFIFMPTFPLGRSRGNSLRKTWNSLWWTAISGSWLALHQGRTKQGRSCSHSTLALDDLWAISRGLSQQDLSCQSFVEHFGHMADQTQLWSLSSGKWFNIQGSANFTAAHFVAKCHTRDKMRGKQYPTRRITGGGPKNPTGGVSFFSSVQCCTFTPRRP